MPLQALSMFLPLMGALLFTGFGAYEKFVLKRSMPAINASARRRAFRIVYILLIIVNLAISAVVWQNFSEKGTTLYALGSCWSCAFGKDPNAKLAAFLHVDPFGAISAVLMGISALIAAFSALADKRKEFTLSQIIFSLTTIVGLQGMFYANRLFAFVLFLACSQIGTSDLLWKLALQRPKSREVVIYLISRISTLLMILLGVTIIFYSCGTDNIFALSSALKSGWKEKAAFCLILSPLLYIFLKPSPYVTAASKRAFLAIRGQAAFFAVFKVLFSLYGPASGLEKVPFLLAFIGLAALLISLIFAMSERDPIQFAHAEELFMKGLLLVSLGLGFNGIYSARSAAQYGSGAIEALVSLWITYLPTSAALSVICCHLKSKAGNMEIWRYGGLAGHFPLSCVLFAAASLTVAGTPPFISYVSRQFLYRVSVHVSPFLTLILYASSFIMLLCCLRWLSFIYFSKRADLPKGTDTRGLLISIPAAILLTALVLTSAMPGKTMESLIYPSVDTLVNKGSGISLKGEVGF